MNRPVISRRIWLTSVAVFAAAAGGLASLAILNDRAATMRAAEDHARTVSRLLMAHADAALEDANKVIKSIAPQVENWDPADEREGRRLTSHLKDLILGSPQVTSAWVLDARGHTIVNNWSWPPDAISGADRPYFQAHVGGAAEPVIRGDERVGPVTGKERFTFSRALRNPDGSLRAILAVGIYTRFFDNLYAEVATRPGARAGLFTLNGTVLGRLRATESPPREFVVALEQAVEAEPNGARVIREPDGPRIVAWQRSSMFPGVFSTTSQPVNTALADWVKRSWLIGATTAAAMLACLGVIFISVRAAEHRHKLRMADLLAREVHHRVKNSLQLISSLLTMRAHRSKDEAVVEALMEGARQVTTISSVHDLLQRSPKIDKVDLVGLVNALCDHLGHEGIAIVRNVADSLLVDAAQASTIGIMANELITNALKHAMSSVEVRCEQHGADFVLAVADDGPGLPEDFDLRATGRFGLLTVKRLSTFLGGSLDWGGTDKGAEFVLRIPKTSLLEPEPA